jgi:hypothetical protein
MGLRFARQLGLKHRVGSFNQPLYAVCKVPHWPSWLVCKACQLCDLLVSLLFDYSDSTLISSLPKWLQLSTQRGRGFVGLDQECR